MRREKNGCMKTWGSEGFALPTTSFDTAIFSVYSSFVCAHWTKKQRQAADSLKKSLMGMVCIYCQSLFRSLDEMLVHLRLPPSISSGFHQLTVC